MSKVREAVERILERIGDNSIYVTREKAEAWVRLQESDGLDEDTPVSALALLLAVRDEITAEDANELVREAKLRVENGDNPEEVLEEDFGLEPDYIFDIID